MVQDIQRKIKSVAIQRVIRAKKTDDTTWTCCGTDYYTHEAIGRHVHADHTADIEQWQDRLWKERLEHEKEQQQQQQRRMESEFRKRRAPKGSSDPINVNNCDCDVENCRVILFYKYVSVDDPDAFAQQHQNICQKQQLTGKVRIAHEGVNITLAGTSVDIETYLDWITTTPPFIKDNLAKINNNNNNLTERRYHFFKPSKGCRHVFSDLSIKVVDEICPLGRPSLVGLNQLQAASSRIKKLEPHEFHEMVLAHHDQNKETVLLDTRNYYESRIGLFKDAVTPAIRKFSRFPEYVDRNRASLEGKTIFTYCTGGIRCEKATAYMHQVLSPDTKIHMLKGGIHNYIEWCKTQRHEDDKPSLWLGKNYVFDARQALSLADDPQSVITTVVSVCQECKAPWDVYQKCGTRYCHLLVLYCTDCTSKANKNVYCCSDCANDIRGDDGVCGCERRRRAEEMKPIASSLSNSENGL
ncbi:hypothetical protein BDB00DRAFT_884779 [Zychaea mexicana]|uniref:uncharacterized protein n=1 Tax=Zychaea mexicana TaxID=64656 RepID=UPI0022FDD781|nr:uncharacterized protein BDB00DRAFT_884779 [Zychaea mexicana]KAI9488652.1 hypothetical protein BDB00DRAFT_884779 [Zychaea mexicana]